MQKNKLVSFLRLMRKPEIVEFKKYLISPVFNTRESMLVLLEVLLEEYIEGDGNANKEAVYRKVFGGSEFKEASFKASMSALLSLLRDFLAFHQYQSDKVGQNRYLLQKLNALDDRKFFPQYHKAALRDLEMEELISPDYFQELSILNEEEYEFISRGPRRDPEDHLKAAIQNRIFSFLVRMMRFNNASINRKHSFTAVFEPAWMKLVGKYVGKNLDELPSILQAYHHVSTALANVKDQSLFEKARAFLRQNQTQFSRQELEELYTSCLNHAARELNKGKLEYLETVYGIYIEMLAMGLIIEKGKISPWHFKNIVVVASRLGKFSWGEKFVDDWQGKVIGEYKGNAKNYNLGILNYYQGRFEQAEHHFNRLLDDYKDIFYGINARGYLLQIYFEVGNTRGLESLCHSYRMFLDRSPEVAEVKRRQHITFINHLRRFIGIPLNDLLKLQALKDEILNKEHRGMGSKWLLSKIDQQLSVKA